MAKPKKTSQQKFYSESDVSKCLREIHQGMSVRKACSRNRVPRSTVKFRLGKKCKEQGRTGPPTALGRTEENELVEWIRRMARKGFPVTRYRLMGTVTSYINSNPDKGRFKTGKPSESWFRSFMQRHKELSIRKPEGVTNASANVVEQDIRKWFADVYDILQEEGLVEILRNAKCVLNGDESSFYLDPAVSKVISMRGEKNVYKVDQGPAKKNVTVMFTCSADGKMYPPMVVLPYKKIPTEVTRSVPADWGIGKTDSGWMTTSCFLKYVKNILHPQLVEENAIPAIYFIDGHSSHTAWETADECRKLGIHLVCLYANCTRILQPLDVAVFKPLKTGWIRVVDDWKLANPNKYIRTENFAPLLSKAMKAVDEKVVRNGFECCGLFPFNANNVDYSKCLGRNQSLPLPQEDEQIDDICMVDDVHQQVNPGVADDPGTAREGTPAATFPVVRSEAEEILQLMGSDRWETYKSRGVDEFDSLDEKILAPTFKLLEPLTSMGSNLQHIGTDEGMEEVLEEYLIDQPEDKIEHCYILEIEPTPHDEEAPLIDEDQGTTQMEHKKGDVMTVHDNSQQSNMLSAFLESPETPHRKGTMRYKRKSPAVLTSRRRLMFHVGSTWHHKAVEEEKKKEVEVKRKKAEEKKKKAEERKIKQAQKSIGKSKQGKKKVE